MLGRKDIIIGDHCATGKPISKAEQMKEKLKKRIIYKPRLNQ